MNYNFENNILEINNQRIELNDEIKEVIEFDGILVIRTDYFESTTNENIYGINIYGKIEWQIKKMTKLTHNGIEYNGISEPYTSIMKLTEKTLKLINWDSTNFEIYAKTGEIKTNPMLSRIGKRSW
ncbi:hypothetical protein ES692_17600 [Psychroserpens burtonensis]|uniref:Uncharacterized protein n=1 Tax=Psychroserpens burtonensis TaxID=49278 RepID=A0A5C7BAL9_9FLAO|nr:hypothetical protein [Psychroserpens burtonensis]TXE14912.1 hypothetical protein ES692_17600 [Psychroserpens burtonensis]